MMIHNQHAWFIFLMDGFVGIKIDIDKDIDIGLDAETDSQL